MTESSSASKGTARSLPPLPFDVDDGGPVVGGTDIADIGLAEFLGAQAGEQPGELGEFGPADQLHGVGVELFAGVAPMSSETLRADKISI